LIHNDPPPTERLHASCVSVGSHGVLLMGSSGSGKSDLALRLLARGAMLVADDQVMLRREEGRLIAGVDASIRGLLEIHGVGLVKYPVASNIPVRLVVQLVALEAMEHIPTPQHCKLLDVPVPQIGIYGFDASAPDKIYAALHAMQRGNLHTGFLPDTNGGGQ
jgi:HPr kinase/phosphorylase